MKILPLNETNRSMILDVLFQCFQVPVPGATQEPHDLVKIPKFPRRDSKLKPNVEVRQSGAL